MRYAMNLFMQAAVLVIMAVPALAEVTGAPYHSTLEAARQAAGERPVLIDFFTNW